MDAAVAMLAAGPTTRGYPKLATVVRADLTRLAPLVPGADPVCSEAVSVEEAQRASVEEARRYTDRTR